jgi:hypothetical protein
MHNMYFPPLQVKVQRYSSHLVHTIRAAEVGCEEKITRVLQVTEPWASSPD